MATRNFPAVVRICGKATGKLAINQVVGGIIIIIIIIRTTTMMMIITIIIIIIIIKKSPETHNLRFFLQYPNCLQQVCSSGLGAIVCKSRATHGGLIMCHMVQRDSSTIKFKLHLF